MTTFYAAAILAELPGAERLHCLITDSDVNRVWAPPDPARSAIRYFAPTDRARRRMMTYGVPKELIRATGYPLPHELVGGRDRTAPNKNLIPRLSRLRAAGRLREAAEAELGPPPPGTQPPLVCFRGGGAGAQG